MANIEKATHAIDNMIDALKELKEALLEVNDNNITVTISDDAPVEFFDSMNNPIPIIKPGEKEQENNDAATGSVQRKFCRYCGTEIISGDRFCANCGKTL